MPVVPSSEAVASEGILSQGHPMKIKQEIPQIVPSIGLFHKGSEIQSKENPSVISFTMLIK